MGGAATAGGLGAALALAGLGFAVPSLLVAGLALAALALAAVAWVGLATRGIRLRRLPGPERIVEGQPYRLRVTWGGGRLPPPGGELREALLAAPLPVGPRRPLRLDAELRLEGRGRRLLGRARLEVADPLRLRVKRIEAADAGELLVLPRVEPVRAPGAAGAGPRLGAFGGLAEAAAASRLDARAVEFEIDGLRPYRAGGTASRIHWPVYARRGELVERRLVAGSDTAPLVVLDASDPAGERELDLAVRAAASLCVHLARAGGCAVLLPGDRRPAGIDPELRAWPAVHARLALVEAGTPLPGLRHESRPGAVLWVSAAPPPARLPPRVAGGSVYFVSPLAGPAGAEFEVAGCTGVRLGRRAPARRRETVA